jgi:DNA helicase II / ATP-dependent DNA helicase PcrA
MPMLKRFELVIKDIQTYVREVKGQKLSGKDKSRIWEAVPGMFKFTQVFDLYKDFYQWMGRPELFKTDQSMTLEYADVFALIYFRIRLEGISTYDRVKHLLVDEMQD